MKLKSLLLLLLLHDYSILAEREQSHLRNQKQGRQFPRSAKYLLAHSGVKALSSYLPMRPIAIWLSNSSPAHARVLAHPVAGARLHASLHSLQALPLPIAGSLATHIEEICSLGSPRKAPRIDGVLRLD